MGAGILFISADHIRSFTEFDVNPVVVFDGQRLPAKSNVNETRKR